MSAQHSGEPCDPNCVHCAVSQILLARQPLTLADVCLLGQVIADIVASVRAATDREIWGRTAQREIGKMLDEAIAGGWHGRAGS